MTACNRAWRAGGLALMGAGYAVPLGGYLVPGSATYEAVTVLIGMPLAIVGAPAGVRRQIGRAHV